MSDIITAIILGIVEGITEFLPVSSTGHLILANEFFTFADSGFAAMFDIVIQSGAILSVILYFRHRLLPVGLPAHRDRVLSLWRATIVGVIPALVLGAAFGDLIEEKLFNPFVVAGSLLIGGIVILIVERRTPTDRIAAAEDIPLKIALLIGLIQCLAMVPGVSRSAATIIGAMLLGTSRLAAAEFSFFLAIPTIGAATAYSLLKHAAIVTGPQAVALAVGFAVSFITAYAVIALFMRWISTRTFAPFGWYRIALSLAVVAYFAV